jgi:phage tail tape-measure protein
VDTGVKPIDLDVRVATAQAQAARLAVDLDKLQNPKPIEIKANATQAQGAIEGVVGTLGKLALAYGGLQLLQQGLGAVADAAIGFNAKLEQAQTAFTGLLGSTDKAKDYLHPNSNSLPIAPPFEFEDVERGAQRFMGMGVAAKDVIPIMTDIGNAVAKIGGSKEEINRVEIADLPNHRQGQGASAQEMNQLAENGIQGWKILADSLHKTVAEVMADSRAGQNQRRPCS